MEGIDVDALRRMNIYVINENGGTEIRSKNFKTLHREAPQKRRK